MTTIDITKLTPEQKQQIAEQVAAEKAAEKETRKQNLEALEELAKAVMPDAFAQAVQAAEILAQAKANIFELFREYLKLKLEIYESKSTQKSHTITVGNQSIILGYRVTDGYTDDANYGIAKIHDYISSLGTDKKTKQLTSALFRLLQKNAKGDLDSKKVLELAQMAQNEWAGTPVQEGVEIIQESFRPKMSRWFIEAKEVNGQGVERTIPLSITSADLPADFDLSFLLPAEACQS